MADLADDQQQFMEGIDGLVNSMLKKSGELTGPKNIFEGMEAFCYAIDWKEPWLITLLCFHASILMLAVLGRHWLSVQGTLLCFAMAMVMCAEWINEYGANNWRNFATQDYFDKGGIFISMIFSAPLIIVSFFILVNGVCSASSLLVEVKTKQLKRQRGKKGKKAGAEGSNASTTSSSTKSPKRGSRRRKAS